MAFLFLLWGSQLFALMMTPKERKSSFFSFSPSFLIRKSEVARGGRMCRYQEVKKWSDDFRAAFPRFCKNKVRMHVQNTTCALPGLLHGS